MATGAITITAGKTWDAINGEIVDLSKMNQAANPTARVNENTVGRRELITAFVTEHDDVIGGLVTATLLTLVLLPILYERFGEGPLDRADELPEPAHPEVSA